MLLCDVLTEAYEVKPSLRMERISALPSSEQERIYAVIDTLIQYAEWIDREKSAIKSVLI